MTKVPFVLIAPLTLALFGCSNPVTSESLAGTYVATTFALSGGATEDVLAVGGRMTIFFWADSTTSGTLFVPAASAASGGMDFTADMAGTFALDNDSITLTQAADSFAWDLTWTVDGAQINGVGTFSGVTITIVLDRACCFILGEKSPAPHVSGFGGTLGR